MRHRDGRDGRTRLRHGLTFLLLLCSVGCVTVAPKNLPASDAAEILEGLPVREFGTDRCGAGSLSAVLTYFGYEISLEQLDEELPKARKGGVLSVDLLLAARRHGFEASWITGDEAHVRDAIQSGVPVILMLQVLDGPGRKSDLFHYVVVDGVDPERSLFRFQFGDGETRWSPFNRSMSRAWKGAGHAMLLVRPQPGDPLENLREAVALENEGRYPEAIEHYRDVLEREPGLYRGWVNLANSLSRLARYEEAESAYRRGLELAPRQPDALNNLAWILLDQGERLDEAEQLARRAARLGGPQLPYVLDTLGRVLLARGSCGEAASTFRRALQRNRREELVVRVALLQGLAEAHQSCGDLRGARSFLEEALDPDPGPQASAAIRRQLDALGE